MITTAALSDQTLTILSMFYLGTCILTLEGSIRAADRRNHKAALLSGLLLAANMVMVAGINTICRQREYGKIPGSFEQYFLRMPLLLHAGIITALIVLEALLWFYLLRSVKASLTTASVREGMDQMSDGICFGSAEGIPLLVNRKMQELHGAIFGTGVMETRGLCDLIGHHDKVVYYQLEDGHIWNIRRNIFAFGKRHVTEYMAYDVTELFQKSRELEEGNRRMAQINEQIRIYSSNMDAVIRDKEILDAKIRLHDNVGRSLLALRAYLSSEQGNREALVSLWKQTIAILKQEAEEPEEESRFEALIKAARAVDVELVFDGEIPKVREDLMAAVIHECLTNTVKHAGGSRLTVKIRPSEENQTGRRPSGDDQTDYLKNKKTVESADIEPMNQEMYGGSNPVIVELTNDGRQPEEEIVEKGGLKNLRHMVEMQGGSMVIESLPRFRMRIVI